MGGEQEKQERSGPVSRILFLRRSRPHWRRRPFLWADRLPVGSSTLPAAPRTVAPVSRGKGSHGTGRPAARISIALLLPMWACWRWGLPCHDRHRPRGALLPHHFTLACDADGLSATMPIGGVFSVALSLASLPVAVSHHRALPSSDFPPGGSNPPGGRLAHSARGALYHP